MYGKTRSGEQKHLGGIKAQAMVEFALILPFLVALIIGIIEIGRVMIIYASVTNASREASRFGSAIGFNDTTYYRKYQYCSAIRDAAKRSSFLANVQDTNIVIEYDHGPSTSVFDTCPSGVTKDTTIVVSTGKDRIKVTVTATYNPITSLIPISSKTITSVSARTILGFVNVSYP
jgi:Flp pilus assembly protein TadG